MGVSKEEADQFGRVRSSLHHAPPAHPLPKPWKTWKPLKIRKPSSIESKWKEEGLASAYLEQGCWPKRKQSNVLRWNFSILASICWLGEAARLIFYQPFNFSTYRTHLIFYTRISQRIVLFRRILRLLLYKKLCLVLKDKESRQAGVSLETWVR